MMLDGRELSIETGRIAKQANGSVLVQYGGTVILATVVASKEPIENRGFFPLQVEYREKAYAAGKIPGGFFKREGKPQEKEVLSARLIDRPIRPLFPNGFNYEVQVAITVLSSDRENDADVLGTIGASAALSISDIPFDGPIASVRVGRSGGQFIINPTFCQLDDCDMELVVAASEDAIAMVEGESLEISEEEMLDSIEFGHKAIREIINLQNELIAEVNPQKMDFVPPEKDEEMVNTIREIVMKSLPDAISTPGKMNRNNALRKMNKAVHEALDETYPEQEMEINEIIHDIEKEYVRNMILNDKKRIDGRSMDDIRDITCETSVLPRTHGSALFTRGETQSLTVATLGTKSDEQKIEGLDGSAFKSYMLHYNFPPFSVGEVKRFMGPGRREIGHGNLAERALKPVIPSEEAFPYTLRIVSDIMESNGSSSMATVCAGSLSMMDAGVPVKSTVAGIAMGLIKEDEKVEILTDILGDEDHLGDMDFKVAGTKTGITAFQMDIKIAGISSEIMKNALAKAKDARFRIIDLMEAALPAPRNELSPFAPRIIAIRINPDEIGMVIGPGGKNIREIIEKSGAEVNIDDEGIVQIASEDAAACEMAKEMIQRMTEKPEAGKIYKGKVKKIAAFGAFVEIIPGKEGLLHISNIAPERINKVEDVLKVGQEVEVKLMSITPEGKMDLNRKILLQENKDS